MKKTVDLNCDLGEGFGAYDSDHDAELMKHITSANIACGFHAGDFSVMYRTVELALKNNVVIGAHPSLPDLQGFGRRTMAITPQEVYELTLYQIGALHAFVKARQSKLHHVKPHGALYNMAAKDPALSDAIVKAVKDFDPSLILYGLANSAMIDSARTHQLNFCEEVFADRTYQDDGSLTPRNQAGALIENTEESLSQVIRMVDESSVVSVQGKTVKIKAGTICIHGDGSHAAEFAAAIRHILKSHGVLVAPPSV